MRRSAVAAEREAAGPWSPEDDEMAKWFPTLAAFVMDVLWDDGVRRKPGTVMLVNDAGTCKAWVHDVDGRKAAWVSATTLWGLLVAVDVGLREERLEWRADKKK